MDEQAHDLRRIIPLEDLIHQIRGQRVMLVRFAKWGRFVLQWGILRVQHFYPSGDFTPLIVDDAKVYSFDLEQQHG